MYCAPRFDSGGMATTEAPEAAQHSMYGAWPPVEAARPRCGLRVPPHWPHFHWTQPMGCLPRVDCRPPALSHQGTAHAPGSPPPPTHPPPPRSRRDTNKDPPGHPPPPLRDSTVAARIRHPAAPPSSTKGPAPALALTLPAAGGHAPRARRGGHPHRRGPRPAWQVGAPVRRPSGGLRGAPWAPSSPHPVDGAVGWPSR